MHKETQAPRVLGHTCLVVMREPRPGPEPVATPQSFNDTTPSLSRSSIRNT